MINIMEQPTTTSAATGMAISRALAKARAGNTEALRWLIEQRRAGNALAVRAVAEFQRVHGMQAVFDQISTSN